MPLVIHCNAEEFLSLQNPQRQLQIVAAQSSLGQLTFLLAFIRFGQSRAKLRLFRLGSDMVFFIVWIKKRTPE